MILVILVGGFKHFSFHNIWVVILPNWRTPSFFRGLKPPTSYKPFCRWDNPEIGASSNSSPWRKSQVTTGVEVYSINLCTHYMSWSIAKSACFVSCCIKRVSPLEILGRLKKNVGQSLFGGFLKWGVPEIIQTWTILVLKTRLWDAHPTCGSGWQNFSGTAQVISLGLIFMLQIEKVLPPSK